MLHVGPSKLRRYIAEGLLRVRDPRITASSLALLLEKRNAHLDVSNEQRLAGKGRQALRRDQEAYSWGSAARTLCVDLGRLRKLIVSGDLKIMDSFVTERAFEDFCRNRGSELNPVLLGDAVRNWLVEGYSLSPSVGKNAASTAGPEKHALVLRFCPKCRRPMRGNIFFRHIKVCKELPRENFAVA